MALTEFTHGLWFISFKEHHYIAIFPFIISANGRCIFMGTGLFFCWPIFLFTTLLIKCIIGFCCNFQYVQGILDWMCNWIVLCVTILVRHIFGLGNDWILRSLSISCYIRDDLKKIEPSIHSIFNAMCVLIMWLFSPDVLDVRSKQSNSREPKQQKLGDMWNKTRTLLQQWYAPYNQRLAQILNDDKYLWGYSWWFWMCSRTCCRFPI